MMLAYHLGRLCVRESLRGAATKVETKAGVAVTPQHARRLCEIQKIGIFIKRPIARLVGRSPDFQSPPSPSSPI